MTISQPDDTRRAQIAARLKQIREDVQPGRRGASTDDARFLLSELDAEVGRLTRELENAKAKTS